MEKIKTVFIVLILITVGLAIGIGEVCATDNATNTSDEVDFEVPVDNDDAGSINESSESDGNQSADENEREYNDYDYYQKGVLTPTKLTTTYNSGKTFNVKVASALNSSHLLEDVEIKLRVYTKGNYKDYYDYTDSNGIIKFKVSNIALGTHKVEVSSVDFFTEADPVTSTVIIKQAKTTVKAPAVTVKKSAKHYFKVTVKNSNGKVIKNLKLKVKVFTGKKSKTYTIKTNQNGIASLSTKSLKLGTHKVVVSSGDSKYKVAKTSKITVKKTLPKKKTKTITIKLSKLDKEYTVKYGKYTIEAMKWKASSYQEVDIFVYNGDNMLNKKKYSSKVFYSYGSKSATTPWKHGSVECTYHKYQFGKLTSINKVQIKI